MANVNPATASGNASGNKKEAEASGLTLSHPGEAAAPAKPGTPFPTGPSGRLVRIDN